MADLHNLQGKLEPLTLMELERAALSYDSKCERTDLFSCNNCSVIVRH